MKTNVLKIISVVLIAAFIALVPELFYTMGITQAEAVDFSASAVTENSTESLTDTSQLNTGSDSELGYFTKVPIIVPEPEDVIPEPEYDMTEYDLSWIDDLDINIHVSEEDAVALAKMAWGETASVRGMTVTLSDGTQRYVSNTEQIAACYWVVLNRIDAGYADNIVSVVSAPGQFSGYHSSNHVSPALVSLAKDCIIRWQTEKILKELGISCDIGRVLPKPDEDNTWCYFNSAGNGHNKFRSKYSNGTIYDWSLSTPYEQDITID